MRIDPSAGLDEDQKAIQNVIYSLADSTSDLDQFRGMFAADKAPPSSDRAKYKEYVFFVVGDIAVTGSTASFTAGMETQVGEEEPVVVEKPWTAVKEADGWKLNERATSLVQPLLRRSASLRLCGEQNFLPQSRGGAELLYGSPRCLRVPSCTQLVAPPADGRYPAGIPTNGFSRISSPIVVTGPCPG